MEPPKAHLAQLSQDLANTNVQLRLMRIVATMPLANSIDCAGRKQGGRQ
jgi:hypothetical protein